MAIRRESLAPPPQGVVLRFPEEAVRSRRRQERMLARRRRSAAVGAMLVIATAGLMRASGGEGVVASRPAAPRVATVSPGDTLWDLADRFAAAETDPRLYVGALARLNELGGELQVGARIRLPRPAGFSDGKA